MGLTVAQGADGPRATITPDTSIAQTATQTTSMFTSTAASSATSGNAGLQHATVRVDMVAGLVGIAVLVL
jgi:hypothetical protein